MRPVFVGARPTRTSAREVLCAYVYTRSTWYVSYVKSVIRTCNGRNDRHLLLTLVKYHRITSNFTSYILYHPYKIHDRLTWSEARGVKGVNELH